MRFGGSQLAMTLRLLATYWAWLLICLQLPLAQALEELICSGETLQLQCSGPEMVLVVESASYGRKSQKACGGKKALLRPCSLATTLALVNGMCFGKESCEIRVDATTFKDPCPGISKYLNVTYRCIDKSNIINVCENFNVASLGGYLISPGYPQQYQPNEDCRLQFDHPPRMAAQIGVLDLEVEARNEAKGCFDWLILREEEVVVEKHDYCGNMLTMSAPKSLTFEHLNLYFKTDAVHQYRGFLLKFTAVPSSRVNKAGGAVPPAQPFPAAQNLAGGVGNLNQEQIQLLDTVKSLQSHMNGGHRRGNLIFDNAANREMMEYLQEQGDEKQLHMLAMLGGLPPRNPKLGKSAKNTGDGCSEENAREHLPLNGILHGFKKGKIFHIRCAAGYQLTDEDEAIFVCSENSWVGAGTAQCQKFSCSEPVAPLHGTVEAEDSHYGSQAYFTCERGYRLQGDAVRTCLRTGYWSGHEPTCKAINRPSHSSFNIPIEIPFAVALTLLYLTCKKRLAKIPGSIRNKVV